MPKVRVKQDDFKPRNQGRPIPLAASVRLSRSPTKDANGAMIACVEIGHGMTVAVDVCARGTTPRSALKAALLKAADDVGFRPGAFGGVRNKRK